MPTDCAPMVIALVALAGPYRSSARGRLYRDHGRRRGADRARNPR